MRMVNLHGHFVTRANKLGEVYFCNGAQTDGVRIKLGKKFMNWFAKVVFITSFVVRHPVRAHVVVKVTKDNAKLRQKQTTSDRHPLRQIHERWISYFQHLLRERQHSL